MSDKPIFLFGLFVTLLLGGGLTVTISEFSKMGDKDQNDSYPDSGPWKRKK